MKKLLKISFLLMGILILLSNGGCSSILNWLEENAQQEIVFVKSDQDIEGHKTFKGTSSVNNPVNMTDAANKAYVDNAVSANESDPIFSASDAFGITIVDIDNWNTTEWNDLEDKPTTLAGYGITDAVTNTLDINFINSLKKGDKVLTIGGIYGRVQEVKDNYVMLDAGGDVKLKVDKNALRRPSFD